MEPAHRVEIHDLRHAFASWSIQNGGDLYELATLLGHANRLSTSKQIRDVRRY
ncbi:tyrosine-type recombinase/integrase [Granulicella aggregans]|uniref:tyrosine-type recombinase/integrase n=1 Tax=Granulicella aggregans TaxID=474949 RepID=UPI0037BFF028